jgi:hypothetical protein
VYSGTVGDGKSSANYSVTFDKNGKLVSSSITVNGGEKQVGQKQKNSNASTAGTSSVRSNTASNMLGTLSPEMELPKLPSVGPIADALAKSAGKALPLARAGTVVGGMWPSDMGDGGWKNPLVQLTLALDAAWALGNTSIRDQAQRNPSGNVLIGETQSRVVANAPYFRATTFMLPQQLYEENPSRQTMMATMVFNAAWINGAMDMNMNVWDIGFDPKRGAANRSPFFMMERTMIYQRGYPRHLVTKPVVEPFQ